MKLPEHRYLHGFLLAFGRKLCYEECVLKAVNLGSDTDTVAAVAGALAGCLYGIEGIPEKWYEGLLRKDMIAEICIDFTNGVLANANNRRLVDVHGHYVFGIDDGASTIKAATEAGYTDIYKTSLLGVGDLEKRLGRKKFNEVLGKYVIKPAGAPTLVPETDPRKPYSDAASDFNQ